MYAPKQFVDSQTWAGNIVQIRAAFQILKEMVKKTEDNGSNLKEEEISVLLQDESGNLVESTRSMSLPETINYLNHQVLVPTYQGIVFIGLFQRNSIF